MLEEWSARLYVVDSFQTPLYYLYVHFFKLYYFGYMGHWRNLPHVDCANCDAELLA